VDTGTTCLYRLRLQSSLVHQSWKTQTFSIGVGNNGFSVYGSGGKKVTHQGAACLTNLRRSFMWGFGMLDELRRLLFLSLALRGEAISLSGGPVGVENAKSA
jgi:hypothetical protein